MGLTVTHEVIFHRDTEDIFDWCVANLQRLNRYPLDRQIWGQNGRRERTTFNDFMFVDDTDNDAMKYYRIYY